MKTEKLFPRNYLAAFRIQPMWVTSPRDLITAHTWPASLMINTNVRPSLAQSLKLAEGYLLPYDNYKAVPISMLDYNTQGDAEVFREEFPNNFVSIDLKKPKHPEEDS